MKHWLASFPFLLNGVFAFWIAITLLLLLYSVEPAYRLVDIQNEARIIDQPLAGVGFGRDAMKIDHPDVLPADPGTVWHAQNLFLKYGLALGKPGMIVLVMLFASLALIYCRMFSNPDQELSIIAIAGLMPVMGVSVRNSTDDLFRRDVAMLFWLMNGLLLGYGLRLQQTIRRSTG